MAWEHLGIPVEELEEVARGREDWASLLRLLPRPTVGKRKKMDGWKDGRMNQLVNQIEPL